MIPEGRPRDQARGNDRLSLLLLFCIRSERQKQVMISQSPLDIIADARTASPDDETGRLVRHYGCHTTLWDRNKIIPQSALRVVRATALDGAIPSVIPHVTEE